MARTFAFPQGAGLLGPGTDGLLRTVLIDAFDPGTEPAKVLLTRSHLEELLGDDVHERTFDQLGASLRVVETLEDAIEHLEERALWEVTGESAKLLPRLWLAAPGADADVVYRTLASLDIVGLFKDAWPYGPTYLIDADGPRQLTSRISLSSAAEAISKLSAAR
ncbi:hypothetical protein [Actinomadura nitritigenes]|uniref:hypothetical protein n=1 Tax=Actinomadura nitritigenes TaxID=134602 RepID=UPI003D8F92D2